MAENKSKSGIEGPAGYNGKAPSSIAAPVKSYPGSGKIGHGGGPNKNEICGPTDDVKYDKPGKGG